MFVLKYSANSCRVETECGDKSCTDDLIFYFTGTCEIIFCANMPSPQKNQTRESLHYLMYLKLLGDTVCF
jgi:hypothetical protein